MSGTLCRIRSPFWRRGLLALTGPVVAALLILLTLAECADHTVRALAALLADIGRGFAHAWKGHDQ